MWWKFCRGRRPSSRSSKLPALDAKRPGVWTLFSGRFLIGSEMFAAHFWCQGHSERSVSSISHLAMSFGSFWRKQSTGIQPSQPCCTVLPTLTGASATLHPDKTKTKGRAKRCCQLRGDDVKTTCPSFRKEIELLFQYISQAQAKQGISLQRFPAYNLFVAGYGEILLLSDCQQSFLVKIPISILQQSSRNIILHLHCSPSFTVFHPLSALSSSFVIFHRPWWCMLVDHLLPSVSICHRISRARSKFPLADSATHTQPLHPHGLHQVEIFKWD